MNSQISVRSKNFRIVIPNLTQIKDFKFSEIQALKCQILQRILAKEKRYNLQHYCISVEHHLNKIPHLDILLIYPKSVQFKINHFDYIYKHGNITTYRHLNAAILEYGKKQDPEPLSNLPQDSSQIINIQQLKKDPYSYLYDRMKEDPMHFNVQQYVQRNQLSEFITGWSSIKSKLRDMQNAAANIALKSKPGFSYLTKNFIEKTLTPKELETFNSWPGYATIVDYLNVMISKKGYREMKTKNLLITGAPNTGKTSLFSNPHHGPDKRCVQDSCAVFPIGMQHWFPKYQSYVYHMILWNEAKLTSYQYTTILKLLEGSYMDLPTKGGSSRKIDNPLVIMTSNMTLDQMIQQKFGYNKDYVKMAKANLAVRVQNVIIPKGYDLFLLQKLLK